LRANEWIKLIFEYSNYSKLSKMQNPSFLVSKFCQTLQGGGLIKK
jgi:hypothetical protein